MNEAMNVALADLNRKKNNEKNGRALTAVYALPRFNVYLFIDHELFVCSVTKRKLHKYATCAKCGHNHSSCNHACHTFPSSV